MILRKLWLALASIRNYDRIPRLPRMLAGEYQTMTRQEREVLARLGARDPIGIKVAMRRYGVSTIEELAAVLEHQQPRRRVGHRLWLAIGRVVGGQPYQPHAEEIRKLARQKQNRQQVEIEQRIKNTVKEFNDV
jgi:hypothetical protein